jgi:hypothetical protein
MKLSIHFLVIAACAILFGSRNANGLFEDQVGKFDWYVSIGKLSNLDRFIFESLIENRILRDRVFLII